MKALLLILILGIGLSAYSQQSSLEARLKARTIKDYILLRYNSHTGSIQYEIDPKRENLSKQHSINALDVTEFTSTSDKVNIDIAFINPLKYQIDISTDYIEDNIYKRVNEFTKGLNLLLQTVSNNGLSLTTPIIPSQGIIKNKLAERIGFKKESSLAKKSTIWYNWYLTNDWNKDLKLGENVTLFTKTVFDESEKLFVAFNKEQQCLDSIIKGYEEIVSATEYVDILKGTRELKRRIKAQRQKIDSIYIREIILVNLLENAPEIAANSDKKAGYFYEYTKLTAVEFFEEIKLKVKRDESIISDIEEILQNLELLLITRYDPVLDALILSEVLIKPELTVSVKIEISKNGSKKVTSTSHEFHISEFTYVVPEFSLGVAFTNISYPIYGVRNTSDGLEITKGEQAVNNYAMLGMLNLLPNIVRSSYYPIAQIGLGLSSSASKTLPIIGGGVGVRMFHPTQLAITIGGIWHWEKKLNNLSVGQTIQSTDELEKGSTNVFNSKPNLYIGVQYNFGK